MGMGLKSRFNQRVLATLPSIACRWVVGSKLRVDQRVFGYSSLHKPNLSASQPSRGALSLRFLLLCGSHLPSRRRRGESAEQEARGWSSSTISPRHPKRSASCSRCIAAKVEPWLAVNGWAGEWRCLGAPVGKF